MQLSVDFFGKNEIRDLVAEELSNFHLIDANAWWAGQLLKYQLRVEPWVEELLKNAKERLNFSHPVVG